MCRSPSCACISSLRGGDGGGNREHARQATCRSGIPMYAPTHADAVHHDVPHWRQPVSCDVRASPAARSIVLVPEGDHAELAAAPDAALHLICGGESATTVTIPAGWWTVLVAASGHPTLISDGLQWQAAPGRLLIWDKPLTVLPATGDRWFCLSGPERAWQRACPGTTRVCDLFPMEDACPPNMVENMKRLFQAVRSAPAMALTWQVRDLLAQLHAAQDELRSLLPRCPGRTRNGKHRTLMRLLRIRHEIAADHSVRASLNRLSRRANWTCGHLARIHRGVFGETPIEFALRTRLACALKLVTQSDLAFCEIAEATGFDSASSFTRAFRNHHGLTPTQARNGAGCRMQ